MCGLVGIVAPAPAAPQREPAERGLRALAHRGPDAAGIRALAGGGAACTLAVARLRVIDLSAGADQPMANEHETVWVAYNGELYNFGELRADLEREGHRFRSRTDTEVLVHLYEASGGAIERMLPRLRGMFAFALFDVRRGRLVVARDRLGIKPLYFAELPGGGLLVGSEVRALLATGLIASAPDPAAVAGYLTWGVVPGAQTIVAGIRALPPAHHLVWEAGQWHAARWWAPVPDADPDLTSQREATRLLAAALEDAVTRHLVADRPVGVFLSGGIDSGAVAALAARAAGRVRALTVTFPDLPGTDEAERAAAVASRIGVEHVAVPVTGAEVAASLPEALRAMDQPTWDAVNSWVVCRAARAEGLVVCLSGIGGDELFGGYASFRLAPRLAWLSAVLHLAPSPLRRLMARAASRHAPGGRFVRVADGTRGLDGAYLAMRGLFAPAEVAALLGVRRAANEGPVLPPGVHDGSGAAERVGLLEMTRYLPDQLLRDTDAVSMAHSLEVRVPLLDDSVVRVALAIPPGVRFGAGKRILSASAGVPQSAVKRPFTLPFHVWTQGPLRERLREGLLSDDLPLRRELQSAERRRLWAAFEARRVHWSRPWAVAVLRLWPVANGLGW